MRHKSEKTDSPQPAGDRTTTWDKRSSLYWTFVLRNAIGALCALILCSILVAGLWPFHAPKNQVHWSENENGLRFGHDGTILGSGMFELASSDGPSCSLEVWLEPALTWDTGTILAFYSPMDQRHFALQQSLTDLLLQRETGGQGHQSKLMKLYVDNIFRKKEVFITLTSNGQETGVYIGGQLIARSLHFKLSSNDLTGQLIVATSALQSNSWAGQVRGLAIYKSELTADQVAQHYQDWTQQGKPTVAETERAVALYLFDERAGKIIHNQLGPGSDVYIPERYVVVHQILLEAPWSEVRTQQSYLKDVLINIGGFIPLGLFFNLYFTSVRQMKRGALVTVILGGSVSLMIEVLQAYLPTRYSGITDIITNTLGTCVGVGLYRAVAPPLARAVAARHWAERPGIPPGS